MGKIIKLKTPIDEEEISKLKAGEEVLLEGVIFTARDQANKRLKEFIIAKKTLPVNLYRQIIYYCGPNFKGDKLGSCGPTTSSRMDDYLQPLLMVGVKGFIGKGNRSSWVRELLKKYRGVYFLTYAGCGAYLWQFVKNYRKVAFPDLGAEAIFQLEVCDFPLIVGIDTKGEDIYKRI
ncbi:MAG: FumA C-terminus/TtdB family hydratase beta subunit [Candidatus Omnitrophica bacterium]|nr:FumA C-terminus/TtdB family hydratase beta subunit [Candidatus Omnitrophota bacterium]